MPCSCAAQQRAEKTDTEVRATRAMMTDHVDQEEHKTQTPVDNDEEEQTPFDGVRKMHKLVREDEFLRELQRALRLPCEDRQAERRIQWWLGFAVSIRRSNVFQQMLRSIRQGRFDAAQYEQTVFLVTLPDYTFPWYIYETALKQHHTMHWVNYVHLSAEFIGHYYSCFKHKPQPTNAERIKLYSTPEARGFPWLESYYAMIRSAIDLVLSVTLILQIRACAHGHGIDIPHANIPHATVDSSTRHEYVARHWKAALADWPDDVKTFEASGKLNEETDWPSADARDVSFIAGKSAVRLCLSVLKEYVLVLPAHLPFLPKDVASISWLYATIQECLVQCNEDFLHYDENKYPCCELGYPGACRVLGQTHAPKDTSKNQQAATAEPVTVNDTPPSAPVPAAAPSAPPVPTASPPAPPAPPMPAAASPEPAAAPPEPAAAPPEPPMVAAAPPASGQTSMPSTQQDGIFEHLLCPRHPRYVELLLPSMLKNKTTISTVPACMLSTIAPIDYHHAALAALPNHREAEIIDQKQEAATNANLVTAPLTTSPIVATTQLPTESPTPRPLLSRPSTACKSSPSSSPPPPTPALGLCSVCQKDVRHQQGTVHCLRGRDDEPIWLHKKCCRVLEETTHVTLQPGTTVFLLNTKRHFLVRTAEIYRDGRMVKRITTVPTPSTTSPDELASPASSRVPPPPSSPPSPPRQEKVQPAQAPQPAASSPRTKQPAPILPTANVMHPAKRSGLGPVVTSADTSCHQLEQTRVFRRAIPPKAHSQKEFCRPEKKRKQPVVMPFKQHTAHFMHVLQQQAALDAHAVERKHPRPAKVLTTNATTPAVTTRSATSRATGGGSWASRIVPSSQSNGRVHKQQDVQPQQLPSAPMIKTQANTSSIACKPLQDEQQCVPPPSFKPTAAVCEPVCEPNERSPNHDDFDIFFKRPFIPPPFPAAVQAAADPVAVHAFVHTLTGRPIAPEFAQAVWDRYRLPLGGLSSQRTTEVELEPAN